MTVKLAPVSLVVLRDSKGLEGGLSVVMNLLKAAPASQRLVYE